METLNIESEGLVSAKRTKNERAGVHRWHPYYAGYAEAFVEASIDYLKLSKEHTVLDPWNGSGTTSLVCARRGINTIGFDVNEAMNIFSMAKSSGSLSYRKAIIESARDISASLLDRNNSVDDKDPLLAFMSKSLCAGVRYIFLEIENSHFSKKKLVPQITNSLKKTKLNRSPEQCFLLAALFVTARQLAGYKGGSNPTWVKALEHKPPVKKITLSKQYLKNVESMLEDLIATRLKPVKTLNHLALLGNSRELLLNDNSIDAIITSPPYLTRIDYAMSTRPELLVLSDDKELRSTREATMGAPVIVDKDIVPDKKWGKHCNSVLKAVREHTSKAAKSYYYPNMLQYFRDADDSLKEILRVLKPGAKALVVVQSSYFKEHEIDLGKVYVEMAKNMGGSAKVAFKDVVRGHMAHVNTKSNEYKKDKVFHEDVVEIVKNG